MFRNLSKRSYHKYLKLSEEVKEALNSNRPIVSLESTIITHGLPLPSNIEMAMNVEKVIRDNGCVPATIAFIEGIPTIGCTAKEIEYLANQEKVNKCSRRDIAPTMASRLNGGTTISGTMILSHLAGIDVFATGGLGGVHKNGELTMDVSADLEELGRTPVAVVCAGPKAILDIPRTMEYLETKGCTVATMRSENIPGFYTRNSGVRSPYTFQNEMEAAKIIKSGLDLDLKSGYLFCVPPSEDVALDDVYIKEIIAQAELKARQENITGKNLTPFLLSEIAKYTNGASVKCNIEFVFNNARIASNIARNLSILKSEKTNSYFQPSLRQP